MVGWILSSQANHTFQLHNGDVVFEEVAVPNRVPLGSAIGFLLFLVMINDLLDGLRFSVSFLQLTQKW